MDLLLEMEYTRYRVIMKNKSEIFKNLALITQLGLSMMVPIFLCVGIGVLIDNRFGTWFVIPLLVLGILAGYRNTYMIVRDRMDYAKAHPKTDEESDEDEAVAKICDMYENATDNNIKATKSESEDEEEWEAPADES